MFCRTIPRRSNKFDNLFSCMVPFSSGYSSDPVKKNDCVGLLLNSVMQSLIQLPTKQRGKCLCIPSTFFLFSIDEKHKCKPSTFLFSSIVTVRESEKSRWKAGSTKGYPCLSPLLACNIIHKEESTWRDTKDYSQTPSWPFASAHTKFSNII